jgi:hypothetical protein
MPFDLLSVFSPLVLGSGDLHTHQERKAPQPRGPQIVCSSSGYEWSSTVAYRTPGFRWPG